MFSRKGKKGKLSIIFMIILTLLSQPSLPVQAFGTDGAENKMIDTIKSVVVKDSSGNIIDENTEYPIEQGSKV